MSIGSVIKKREGLRRRLEHRDMITGLPREVIVTDSDIREAIIKSVKALISATKEVIEETPPELVSDIMHRGIVMTGGGRFTQGIYLNV